MCFEKKEFFFGFFFCESFKMDLANHFPNGLIGCSNSASTAIQKDAANASFKPSIQPFENRQQRWLALMAQDTKEKERLQSKIDLKSKRMCFRFDVCVLKRKSFFGFFFCESFPS